MKLDVLPTPPPWHADGLNFTCQQCGNCCTGEPGYVWVSEVELQRLVEFLGMPKREVVEKYCRKVHGKLSLKEVRSPAGLYDCIFLREKNPEAGADGKIAQSTRVCSIYPVRPLQCRTWPFWETNLRSEAAWKRASKGCHGIDRGRKFTLEEIVALRDATDWPERAPTSGDGKE